MVLRKSSEVEANAECVRCRRRSPLVHGSEDNVVRTLTGMGWTVMNGSDWLCPICHGSGSGQYRKTER